MVKINKIDLEELIFVENKSYEEIGRILGVSGVYVKKYAKKLGLKLIPRRKISQKETFNKGKGVKRVCLFCGGDIGKYYKGKKYCSNRCQIDYETKKYLDEWKKGLKSGICDVRLTYSHS